MQFDKNKAWLKSIGNSVSKSTLKPLGTFQIQRKNAIKGLFETRDTNLFEQGLSKTVIRFVLGIITECTTVGLLLMIAFMIAGISFWFL